MSRKEALNLIKSSSMFIHSIQVGKVMYSIAKHLNEDEKEWELVGLLHDLDYDMTVNNREKHGIIATEMLKGQLSEGALTAIKAHDHRTGFKPKNLIDKALKAADALVVFIDLVKEEGALLNLKLIKQKLNIGLKSKPWLKPLIYSCEEFGFTLDDFLRIGLEIVKSNPSS